MVKKRTLIALAVLLLTIPFITSFGFPSEETKLYTIAGSNITYVGNNLSASQIANLSINQLNWTFSQIANTSISQTGSSGINNLTASQIANLTFTQFNWTISLIANESAQQFINMINNTNTLGQLYNVTASMIANLSISQTGTSVNNITISQIANLSIGQLNWTYSLIANTSLNQLMNLTINQLNWTYSLIANTSFNQRNVTMSQIANLSISQSGFTNNWGTNGTNIYNDTTKAVGIGTSTPSNLLEVYGGGLAVVSAILGGGNARAYGILSEGGIDIGGTGGLGELDIYEATPSDEATIRLSNADTGSGSTDGIRMSMYTGSYFTLWLYENLPMVFATNNLERMRIDADGTLNASGNIFSAGEVNGTIFNGAWNGSSLYVNNLTASQIANLSISQLGLINNLTASQIANLSISQSATSGNASWNQSFANSLYAPNTSAGIQSLLNDSMLSLNNFHSNEFYADTMNYSFADDGSNFNLNFPDVAGNNYVGLVTTGGFFQLYANPNPSNGYLLATITETQGAITNINFYEGGVGHNRFWDSGSARFGGDESYLCSNMTTDVDCDTSGTGADIVVQDDGWFGGKLFASDWSNVTIATSQISDFSGGVDNLTASQIANLTIGQFNSTYSLIANNSINQLLNLTINQFNWTFSLIANNSISQMGNYTDKTFNEYNATWDNNGQIQMVSENLTSVNTTKNIQELLNGTSGTFTNVNATNFTGQWINANSTYSDTNATQLEYANGYLGIALSWLSDYIHSIVDSIFAEASANLSSVNTTYNFGVAYNTTASMIANLSIEQSNGLDNITISQIANLTIGQSNWTYSLIANASITQLNWTYSQIANTTFLQNFTTATIGAFYNYTASLIANLSITQSGAGINNLTASQIANLTIGQLNWTYSLIANQSFNAKNVTISQIANLSAQQYTDMNNNTNTIQQHINNTNVGFGDVNASNLNVTGTVNLNQTITHNGSCWILKGKAANSGGFYVC